MIELSDDQVFLNVLDRMKVNNSCIKHDSPLKTAFGYSYGSNK